MLEFVLGDPSGQLKPALDLDLGCLAILSGQWIATVATHQLPELLELSQQEVLTNQMGHPVRVSLYLIFQHQLSFLT